MDAIDLADVASDAKEFVQFCVKEVGYFDHLLNPSFC